MNSVSNYDHRTNPICVFRFDQWTTESLSRNIHFYIRDSSCKNSCFPYNQYKNNWAIQQFIEGSKRFRKSFFFSRYSFKLNLQRLTKPQNESRVSFQIFLTFFSSLPKYSTMFFTAFFLFFLLFFVILYIVKRDPTTTSCHDKDGSLIPLFKTVFSL